eukprot:TRINITY_DN538_c0_g1_i4.p1 TRINITY_DN538_c0_g1~~TRINITY_DN538_c0_g1_i4.p1  ORF type:complete len:4220 (+),score=1035.94 TRINITY_DN538_c0_g1_i4:107-12766(+)
MRCARARLAAAGALLPACAAAATATVTATVSTSTTLTLPSNTGSASLTLPSSTATQTATATVTLPSAAVTLTLPTGTFTLTLPTLSGTTTSTQTLPSQTATLTLPSVSASATATVSLPSATVTITLPSGTRSATATVTLPSVSLTQTVTLPSVTLSFTLPSASTTLTGTVTIPSMTGTVTLPSASQTVSLPSSPLTSTLPSISTTATFTLPSASASATLSLTGTVTLPTASVSGTTTATLPSGTDTVTVTLPSATVSLTLPTATQTESRTTTASASFTSSATATGTTSLPTATSTPSVGWTLTLPTGTVTTTIPSASVTVTQSVTDTFTRTGTVSGTVSIPSTSFSVTVTATLPSATATATASYTLSLPTLSRSASRTGTATVAATSTFSLPSLSKSATATFPSVSETLSLPSTQMTNTPARSSTYSLPTRTETASDSLTLPSFSMSVSSTETVPTPSFGSWSTSLPTWTATITLATETDPTPSDPTTSLTVSLPDRTATAEATTSVSITIPSATDTVSPTGSASLTLPSLTATTSRTATTTGSVTLPSASYTASLPSGSFTASLPSASTSVTMPSATASPTMTLPTASVSVSLPSLTITATLSLPTSTYWKGTPSATYSMPTESATYTVTMLPTEAATETESTTATVTGTASGTLLGVTGYALELQPDPGGVPLETGVHFRVRLYMEPPVLNIRGDSEVRFNLSAGETAVRAIPAGGRCNDSQSLSVHGAVLEAADLTPYANRSAENTDELYAVEGWGTLAAPWEHFRLCYRICGLCEWFDPPNSTVYNVTAPSVYWQPPETYASALDQGRSAGAFVRYRIFTLDPANAPLSTLSGGYGDAAKLVPGGKMCLGDSLHALREPFGYGGYERVAGERDNLADPAAFAAEMGTLYERPVPAVNQSRWAVEEYAWLRLPPQPGVPLALCLRLAQGRVQLPGGGEWHGWRFVFHYGTRAGVTTAALPPLSWRSGDTRRATWGTVTVAATTYRTIGGTPGQPFLLESPQRLPLPEAQVMCVVTEGCAAISYDASLPPPEPGHRDVYFHGDAAPSPQSAPGFVTLARDATAPGSSIDLRPSYAGGAELHVSGDCNAPFSPQHSSADLGSPMLRYTDANESSAATAWLQMPRAYGYYHVCFRPRPGVPWLVAQGGWLTTPDSQVNLTWSLNDTRALTWGPLAVHAPDGSLSAAPYPRGGGALKLVDGGAGCWSAAVGELQESDDLGEPDGGPSTPLGGAASDASGLSTVAGWFELPPVAAAGYGVCFRRALGLNWEMVESPWEARVHTTAMHQLRAAWGDRRVGTDALIVISSGLPELVPVPRAAGGDELKLLPNASRCSEAHTVHTPRVTALGASLLAPDVHAAMVSRAVAPLTVPAAPAYGWRMCYGQWWRNWVDLGLWDTAPAMELFVKLSAPFSSGTAVQRGGVLHYFDISQRPGNTPAIDPGVARDEFKLVRGLAVHCWRPAVAGTHDTLLVWAGSAVRAAITLPVDPVRSLQYAMCYLSNWVGLGSVTVQPTEVVWRNTTPPVARGVLELELTSSGRFDTNPDRDLVFLVPSTEQCGDASLATPTISAVDSDLGPGDWIGQRRATARLTLTATTIGGGSRLRVCWLESATGDVVEVPPAADHWVGPLVVHDPLLTSAVLPGRYTITVGTATAVMAGAETENSIDGNSVKLRGGTVHAGLDQFKLVPAPSAAVGVANVVQCWRAAEAEGDMLQGSVSGAERSVNLRLVFPITEGDYSLCYYHASFGSWVVAPSPLDRFTVADTLLSYEFDSAAMSLTVRDRLSDSGGTPTGTLFPGGARGYDAIIVRRATAALESEFCAPAVGQAQFPTRLVPSAAALTGDQTAALLPLPTPLASGGLYRVCYNKTGGGLRAAAGVWLHLPDTVTGARVLLSGAAPQDTALEVAGVAPYFNDTYPVALGEVVSVRVRHSATRGGPRLVSSGLVVSAQPGGALINSGGYCRRALAAAYAWPTEGMLQPLYRGEVDYRLMLVTQCETGGCLLHFDADQLLAVPLMVHTFPREALAATLWPRPPQTEGVIANLGAPYYLGEWFNFTVIMTQHGGGIAFAGAGETVRLWLDLPPGVTRSEARCAEDPTVPASTDRPCRVSGSGLAAAPYRVSVGIGGRADLRLRLLGEAVRDPAVATLAYAGRETKVILSVAPRRAAALRLLSVRPADTVADAQWLPANSTPFPTQRAVAAQGFAFVEGVRYVIALEILSPNGDRIEYGMDASALIVVRTSTTNISVTSYDSTAFRGRANVGVEVAGVCGGGPDAAAAPGSPTGDSCALHLSVGTALAEIVTPVRTVFAPSLGLANLSALPARRRWRLMLPLPAFTLQTRTQHGFDPWGTGVIVVTARAESDELSAQPPDAAEMAPVALVRSGALITDVRFTRPCVSCSLTFHLLGSSYAAAANVTLSGWAIEEGPLRLAVLGPANWTATAIGQPLLIQVAVVTPEGAPTKHDYQTWVTAEAIGFDAAFATAAAAAAAPGRVAAGPNRSVAVQLSASRAVIPLVATSPCPRGPCLVRVSARASPTGWSSAAALGEREAVLHLAVEGHRRIAALQLLGAGEGARPVDGGGPAAAAAGVAAWHQVSVLNPAYVSVRAVDRNGAAVTEGTAAAAELSISLDGYLGDAVSDGNGTSFAAVPAEAVRQRMVGGQALFGMQLRGPCLRCSVSVRLTDTHPLVGSAAPLVLWLTARPQGTRTEIASYPTAPILPRRWSEPLRLSARSASGAVDYTLARSAEVAFLSAADNGTLGASSLQCRDAAGDPCELAGQGRAAYIMPIPALSIVAQVAARSQGLPGGGVVPFSIYGVSPGLSALLRATAPPLSPSFAPVSWVTLPNASRVRVFASSDPGGQLGNYLYLAAPGHAARGALPSGWSLSGAGAAGELGTGLDYPLTVQATTQEGTPVHGDSGPVRIRLDAAPGCGTGGSITVDGAEDPQKPLDLADGNRTFRLSVGRPCEACYLHVSYAGRAQAPWQQLQTRVGPLTVLPADPNTAVFAPDDWLGRSALWPLGETRTFELRPARRAGVLLHLLGAARLEVEAAAEPLPLPGAGIAQGAHGRVESVVDVEGRLHVVALGSCPRCAVRITTRPSPQQLLAGMRPESFFLQHASGDVFELRATAARFRLLRPLYNVRPRRLFVLALEAVDAGGNRDLSFSSATVVTAGIGGGNGGGGLFTNATGGTDLDYPPGVWENGVLRVAVVWSRGCDRCTLTAIAAAAGVRFSTDVLVGPRAALLAWDVPLPANVSVNETYSVVLRAVDAWGDTEALGNSSALQLHAEFAAAEAAATYGAGSVVVALQSSDRGVINASLTFTSVVLRGQLELRLALRRGGEIPLLRPHEVTATIPDAPARALITVDPPPPLRVAAGVPFTVSVGCAEATGAVVDSSCGGSVTASGEGVTVVSDPAGQPLREGVASLRLALAGIPTGNVDRTVIITHTPLPGAPTAAPVQVVVNAKLVQLQRLSVTLLPATAPLGHPVPMVFEAVDVDGFVDVTAEGFEGVATVIRRTVANGTHPDAGATDGRAAESARAAFVAGAAVLALTFTAVCTACTVEVSTAGDQLPLVQEQLMSDIAPGLAQTISVTPTHLTVTLPAAERSFSAGHAARHLAVRDPQPRGGAFHALETYTFLVSARDSEGRVVDGAAGEVCLWLIPADAPEAEGGAAPAPNATASPVPPAGDALACGELAGGSGSIAGLLPQRNASTVWRLAAAATAAPAALQGESDPFAVVPHAVAVRLTEPPPVEWVARRPLPLHAAFADAGGGDAPPIGFGEFLPHPPLLAAVAALRGTVRPADSQGSGSLTAAARASGWHWNLVAPHPGPLELELQPPPELGAVGGRLRLPVIAVRRPVALAAAAASPAALLGERPLILTPSAPSRFGGSVALSLSVELRADGGEVVAGDSLTLVEFAASTAPSIPGALLPAASAVVALSAGRASFGLTVALPLPRIAAALRVRLRLTAMSPEAGNLSLHIPEFVVSSNTTVVAQPVSSPLLRLVVLVWDDPQSFALGLFTGGIAAAAGLATDAVSVLRACRADATACVPVAGGGGRRAAALQQEPSQLTADGAPVDLPDPPAAAEGVSVDFSVSVSAAESAVGETVEETLQRALARLDAALREATASCAAGLCSGTLASTLRPAGSFVVLGKRPTITETLPVAPAGSGREYGGDAPKAWYWEGGAPGGPFAAPLEDPPVGLLEGGAALSPLPLFAPLAAAAAWLWQAAGP